MRALRLSAVGEPTVDPVAIASTPSETAGGN